jgi:hypothetical protein
MGTLLMVKTLNYIELSNGYVVFMMNLTGNVGLVHSATKKMNHFARRKITLFPSKRNAWGRALPSFSP